MIELDHNHIQKILSKNIIWSTIGRFSWIYPSIPISYVPNNCEYICNNLCFSRSERREIYTTIIIITHYLRTIQCQMHFIYTFNFNFTMNMCNNSFGIIFHFTLWISILKHTSYCSVEKGNLWSSKPPSSYKFESFRFTEPIYCILLG